MERRSSQLFGGAKSNEHLDRRQRVLLTISTGARVFDIAVYSRHGSENDDGVIIDLHLGSGEGGAAGDTFESIEGLYGTRWADVLIGDGNDNVLVGSYGNDRLEGDSSLGPRSFDFDELIGGAGDDILFAGYGDAVLTGNRGVSSIFDPGDVDTFVFADQSNVESTVTVTDFESSDLLDFRSFSAFETAEDIIDQFEQIGDNAVFQSGLTQVVLQDFNVSSLQTDYFIV